MKWTSSQTDAINEKGKDLLVSASAGSGKTTVMIERIASMIRTSQATVDEILVLTFTKATAADMRAKLRRKLDDLDLSTASIGTFHKFCSDLVRTYFNLVGLDPAFDVIDEFDARSLQDEILDKLIAQNYSKCKDAIHTFCISRKTTGLKGLLLDISNFLATREDPHSWLECVALASYQEPNNPAVQKIKEYSDQMHAYYRSKFTGFLMTAQAEGATKIVPFINDCLEAQVFPRLVPDKNFSEYEDFRETRNEFRKELERLEFSEQRCNDKLIVTQTIHLVVEFIKTYSAEKRKRGVLDFADMEHFALQILENPEVRALVHEKYKYIFVDEYQDTSPIQEKILSLVGKPNSIFMVGDVKQSIYGFRGCEVSIFANKLTDFDKNLGGMVVRLNDNFRSHPAILHFVNQVFQKIMPDYSGFVLDKVPQQGAVEVILAQDLTQQCFIVAKKVHELTKKGFRLGDIAILARNSTHFLTLSETLKKAHIPSTLVAKHKSSEIPEINMLMDFLFAVANPTNDIPLVKTMTNPIFGFTNTQIAQVKIDGEGENFYTRLKNVGGFDEFLATLDRYREFSKTHTVAEILDKFLAEFMFVEKMSLERIHQYLDKLRNLGAATNLTRFLYLVEHGMLDIELDEGGSVRDTVQIMTIHKSKGLEFPAVILFDAGARFSAIEKRKFMMIDKDCGLCVYATDLDEYTKASSVARLGALLSGQQAQIEEEKRLLYVALTRAKNKLVLLGSFPSERIPRIAKNYFHFINPLAFNPLHIDADDIDTETIEPEEGRTLPNVADKQQVTKFQGIFAQEAQEIPGTDVVLKNSVTSLTKNEELFLDHTPTRVYPDKDRGLEYGTKFHAEMQRVCFENPTSDDPKIIKAVKTLKPLVDGMKLLREVAFLQKLEQGGAELLVQGIIDLLAVGQGRALLVDYKTTKASKERLVELYRPQMHMYRQAVCDALNLSEVACFIYSSSLDSLLEIA